MEQAEHEREKALRSREMEKETDRNIFMSPSVASRKASVSTPASVTGTSTYDCDRV